MRIPRMRYGRLSLRGMEASFLLYLSRVYLRHVSFGLTVAALVQLRSKNLSFLDGILGVTWLS